MTLLGTGTSFGVPVIGCDCEVCRSDDPRDARLRVSALVETGDGKRILIDTPPEIRLQLVRARIGSVDAVLYTHEHADHVHGIDDLRAVSVRTGTLPLYGSAETLATIRNRFPYIFDPSIRPPRGSSKPELSTHVLEPGEPVVIAGLDLLPLAFEHGNIQVLGFRFGPGAYLTDVKSVPADAIDALRGVKVLVLNALFERPHATHLSIPEAVDVAEAVGAEQTYLTHLTHRYSHRALEERLPDGVAPAHDGLVITF